MNHTYYPRLDETVVRHTLDNGLRILVVKKPGFARKCAYLVTDLGSVHTRFTMDGTEYEMPAGIAHYLEHKMFDLPGRDVNEELAALGANANAFTSYDMTAYFFSCTDRFYESLNLLMEFVTTPYFTDETVEKERGIIAQEILMYDDSPDSRVFEELCRNLYVHHPVRVPIAGSVASIGRITPQMLYDCHRAFYNPERLTLCVAGDVDEERVMAMARERMGQLTGCETVPDLGPEEPMERKEAVTRLAMDVAMPTFQLGFKCPAGLTGREFAHWELVAELACEALMGESSELYLDLYQRGDIDSSFGWGVETMPGVAMVVCGGDSYAPERVRDYLIAEAEQLADEGISEESFQRLLRSFLGRRVKDLDSFESTCFRLCAYGYDGYDYLRFEEEFGTIRREELQNFWREHFRMDRCAMAIVEPRTAQEGEG